MSKRFGGSVDSHSTPAITFAREHGICLTLWKDGDSDIPVLQQAKAEYAKLK